MCFSLWGWWSYAIILTKNIILIFFIAVLYTVQQDHNNITTSKINHSSSALLSPCKERPKRPNRWPPSHEECDYINFLWQPWTKRQNRVVLSGLCGSFWSQQEALIMWRLLEAVELTLFMAGCYFPRRAPGGASVAWPLVVCMGPSTLLLRMRCWEGSAFVYWYLNATNGYLYQWQYDCNYLADGRCRRMLLVP